ncbi:type II toxin-antitoxin system RelE/ParE family toxin (plasmid) [Halomonas sediminis]
MPNRRHIRFIGDSLDRLRDFPQDAKHEAGFQIDRVQSGGVPDDFRPMPSLGPGAMEIRIRESNGAFRVFYVANREEAVYVLHCFQKKSQKTAKRDIELGKQRYKELP